MSFEEKIKKANEALDKLNNDELTLNESVKIYKMGLESIKKAREELEKAKLEVENIDE
ncbi:exodeoxyribonuclease VII small subunit [Campylobacter sp. LH-2024]|uniref:Exodeoxyribonuclease VII small subunit n=1 Tax=Campylobacter molothri TaxID=1032242 RepID=A0ACC5W1U1_9BACT|nr:MULTISPECIES: exodeoxyribonuclease VII small subunit [unclassified Campylobacter]MBZ7928658.1 exodeoxyribonuclease VII small subunit [Campylobacter sp. RM10542]MBZ7931624.1 exodeoxyribonuclease VII small subunit [Campylobacter sp. RM12910]MBZ7933027.1 exodeoxyribonuclease VII small subunit [Campylobacter sp. RM10543]MBZ7934611.1 exodeoxyribonuclease VII small subunit [Campylobacter sp. W0065]MBZ7940500.1 exodeoxyribonuclease VII small subunit [Campylobacter sp. W0047]MBZ7942377.1 exodeoxyr